jgi:hypothetical protein
MTVAQHTSAHFCGVGVAKWLPPSGQMSRAERAPDKHTASGCGSGPRSLARAAQQRMHDLDAGPHVHQAGQMHYR